MKKYSIFLISFLVLFTACENCDKSDKNSKTKVGFYALDATGVDNGTYDLFVDDEFRGKIHCLNYQPECGDPMMVYLTLDGSRHEVDVKNDAGQYVNSEYIKVSKNKCASGSGKNSGKVENGSHGCSFSQKTGDDCASMCFIR